MRCIANSEANASKRAASQTPESSVCGGNSRTILPAGARSDTETARRREANVPSGMFSTSISSGSPATSDLRYVRERLGIDVSSPGMGVCSRPAKRFT